jgi:Flp pilus assembly pilin Flp
MHDRLVAAWVWQQTARAWLMHRLVREESGEGVISAAIAVLIMAFLGVAMWVAFKATLKGATNNVNHQVSNIGR